MPSTDEDTRDTKIGAINDKTEQEWLDCMQRERKKGRQDAFEEWLCAYEKLIHHIARRYFQNPDDAMDACQEAVIKIYYGLPRFSLREGASLKAWVCAVTANACLDQLRKRKHTAEPLENDTLFLTHPSGVSVEDTALKRERKEEILTAITKLPHDHRILIILRDLNGLSYQELAEATNTPVNTVKSRLSRARASLREALS